MCDLPDIHFFNGKIFLILNFSWPHQRSRIPQFHDKSYDQLAVSASTQACLFDKLPVLN